MTAYRTPGVHVEEIRLGAASPAPRRVERPTDRRLTVRPVERSETALSLAVSLADPDTGAPPSPAVAPRLFLEETGAEPVRHRSGYYLFVDVESASVTLRVEGGGRYRDESRAFDLSDPPVVETLTLERTDDGT